MDKNETHTLRTQIGNWVESKPVRNFIIGLILINAITLGMETAPRLVQQYGHILHFLDKGILSVFVIEITLKGYAYGWRFFKSGWNIFDFLIVLIALMPSSGVFSVLRVLRILRVLRLISLIPQLRFIVEALLKAIPGIGAIFLLFLLFYYIFAVIATKTFGPEFPEWFGTLGNSMYTLFKIMTLEGWANIADTLTDKFAYAWLFLIIFILLATFTMLNLFIAIIVDTMQNLHEQEKNEKNPILEVTAHSETEILQQEIRALRSDIEELKTVIRNQL
jgi:voltage-gated sodium channel